MNRLSKIKPAIRLFIATFKPGIIVKSVRMEMSMLCQLKCLSCITLNENPNVLGKGFMKFSDFKNFVDSNPKIRWIEMSNFGEMFLNPELKDIIRYANEKGISLAVDNGVNLNDAKENILEDIVKCNFMKMRVSIDGATNKTYRLYRKGGDLRKVINNIEKINMYKKKYRTPYPEMIWQFILFGHNEHEIPVARKMAKKLGMKFETRFSADDNFSPIKNRDFVMKEAGVNATSYSEYVEKNTDSFYGPCHELWLKPAINWDGKLLGCCCNGKKSFGNVFTDGLEKCLKNREYKNMKKVVLGLRDSRDSPCSECDVYKIYVSKNPLEVKYLLEWGA